MSALDALRPALRPSWPATLDAIVRAHVAEMEAEPVRTEPPVEVEPEITESEYRLLDGNR